MRRDLHRLLDEDYTTLDLVTGASLSASIFERVENGKDYLQARGPAEPVAGPV
jgi:hypothetical protein